MAAMSQQSLYPGLNSQQMQMFPGLQSPTAPPAYNVSYQGSYFFKNVSQSVFFQAILQAITLKKQ